MTAHKFNYKWRLADGFPANKIKSHNRLAFGTFICGGGSSMGYKLSGYNHLGGVEIDKRMASIYKVNLNPKYLFNTCIRTFNEMSNLPEELYSLDLLDGSPPCSSFSLCGNRERDWKKQKRFSEGQELQTLDDLLFHYCNTIIKLQPKVFLLENVKGLILGNAKIYLKNVIKKLSDGGYTCQVFLLNAATMGVPQRRERVFVIGHNNKYKLNKLALNFNEQPIYYGDIMTGLCGADLTYETKRIMQYKTITDRDLRAILYRTTGKAKRFNESILHKKRIPPTLTASAVPINYHLEKRIPVIERQYISSFPVDYDFQGASDSVKNHLLGMAVPPVMIANIAHQIYSQWLVNI